ncbi:MAG: GPW/gp25 family protein [Candidatus Accumulibacter sp.]|jgi:phage baseplate assembly protein W|nr:GPW/gp25 family protein [Accumulibacter sp.]
MYQGMDASTGRTKTDIEHIRQSIQKILTTPIGTRVMRRNFGSIVPDLIDAPINARTRLRVMAATATAVIKWEPRIKPAKITMLMDTSALTVELTGVLKNGPNAGQSATMNLGLR